MNINPDISIKANITVNTNTDATKVNGDSTTSIMIE